MNRYTGSTLDDYLAEEGILEEVSAKAHKRLLKTFSHRNAAKKQREKYFLDKIKSIYPDFPSGEPVPSEEPDFLIMTDGPIIGIEEVDYIRGQGSDGSEARLYEKLNNLIAIAAREEFERNYRIPLSVHFLWSLRRHPRKSDATKIAVDIAKLIENNIPQTVYACVSIDPDLIEESPVGEFIDRISVTRMKPTQKSLWANTEAGFIGVEIGELQKLISSKETKLEAYLQKCNSVWLIVVADASHISSNAELNHTVHGHVFKSQFERILFYDAANHSVIDLKNNSQ